jgi:hypothetical protein
MEAPKTSSSFSKSGLRADGSMDPAFLARAKQVAARIGSPIDWFLACMWFETGGSFRSDVKNAAGSGATGLIQFMPSTAKAMGTSVEKLAEMSAVEQLDWVERYFSGKNFSGGDPRDVYLAIFYPAAIGKSDSWALPSGVYAQNKGLDRDKDGIITAGEIRSTIDGTHQKVLQKGWV